MEIQGGDKAQTQEVSLYIRYIHMGVPHLSYIYIYVYVYTHGHKATCCVADFACPKPPMVKVVGAACLASPDGVTAQREQ